MRKQTARTGCFPVTNPDGSYFNSNPFQTVRLKHLLMGQNREMPCTVQTQTSPFSVFQWQINSPAICVNGTLYSANTM